MYIHTLNIVIIPLRKKTIIVLIIYCSLVRKKNKGFICLIAVENLLLSAVMTPGIGLRAITTREFKTRD